MEKIEEKKLKEIIFTLAGRPYATELDFARAFRQAFSAQKTPPNTKATLISLYRQLTQNGEIKADKNFAKLLTKRAARTLSGVSVITVLSKPFVCPGKCVYCPTEPNMPKSYLSNEPAAARAKMNLFDAIRQMTMRIRALENNGHQVDKLEVLILGGTWSVYPDQYQDEFVRDLFYAANVYGQESAREPLSLEEEQKINEDAQYKIIGLTLETRPDFIHPTEIKKMRRLGATRIQLGIQHTDNKILDYIKRGHSIETSIRATKMLKEAGFKVDHHYMPDLPGSTPAKDLKMFEYVFSSPDLQPDQIKIYPCVVNEYAELFEWYKKGDYKPFSEKELLELLIKVKTMVPPYMRINRLIRDIPEESIIAGNKITNLRQYLQKELTKRGQCCVCIRCREVKNDNKNINQAVLIKREYAASGGQEIFLSYESEAEGPEKSRGNQSKIYAFLRLRINQNPGENIFPELKNASLVRELHVYGRMIPADQNHYSPDKEEGHEVGQSQHLGFGKKLMAEAERLTMKKGLKKIAVISGIGVRNYYRKLGYTLEGTYLTKKL